MDLPLAMLIQVHGWFPFPRSQQTRSDVLDKPFARFVLLLHLVIIVLLLLLLTLLLGLERLLR